MKSIIFCLLVTFACLQTEAANLPAPNLSNPANGATGVSTTPTYSWSAVSGVTAGYYLAVATSSATLPTDPTASTGPGCVIFEVANNTSDTPSTVLNGGTTYYWRVRGRGPGSTYGNWSSIFSFTTVPVFVQTSATNLNWNGIACSADGTKIVAESSGGGIWISTNSGDTWMQTSAPNTNWNGIVSSTDGTKLAAIAGSMIYTSTNSGGTWTSNNTPTIFGYLVSSADGNRLVASGFNHVYTSANAGVTWVQTSAPIVADGYNLTWTSEASSADGITLAGAAYSGIFHVLAPYYTYIYVSTNSGINWNEFVGVPDDSFLISVVLSASGDKVKSVDYWMGVNVSYPSPAWMQYAFGLVSSADCTRLAVLSSGNICVSGDAGNTWAEASAPYLSWNCLASSADGNELIAGANGGIYISKFTAPPALNIAASNKLALSWLMPSANLVLQQNSDLTTANWTDVTNTPILNLTNLQNQVFLPMSGSNSFYRLATP